MKRLYSQKLSKQQTLGLSLRYFLPAVLVIAGSYGLFLTNAYLQNKNLIATNENVQLAQLQKSLLRDFENILLDINVILHNRSFQDVIDQPETANTSALAEDLLTFAVYKRIYSILRFIDAEGMERIRVDYRAGRARIADEEMLQNKAHRYYFKEAITLGTDELYLSPIDLNVERGEIEIPYKPTMRFAVPVFDSAGERKGILVVNYHAERMLQNFDQLLSGSYGHISLLNKDGYWIRATQKEREWGFILGHEKNFGRRHPEAWSTIKAGDKGQFTNPDGLYSYTTIYPLKSIGGNPEHDSSAHAGHRHQDPNAYYWKIASHVSKPTLTGAVNDRLLGRPSLALFAILLVAAAASWSYATLRMRQRLLTHQIQLQAKLYDATSDGVLITDTTPRIIDANQAFTAITGYPASEVIGQKTSVLSSGKHDAAFYRAIWRQLLKEGCWQGEIWNRRKDGALYLEWLQITAIKNDQNQAIGYIGIFSDITSRKLSEQEMQHRAHHDPLTELPNRLLFDDRLDRALATAQRNDTRVALLFIDLDGFKPINDNFGHHVGDQVLKEVANRLLSCVRETDTVARIGGDEFTIVLTDEKSTENPVQVTTRIRDALAPALIIGEHRISIGASIGISLYPDDATDAAQLLQQADAAMYRAKHDRPTASG